MAASSTRLDSDSSTALVFSKGIMSEDGAQKLGEPKETKEKKVESFIAKNILEYLKKQAKIVRQVNGTEPWDKEFFTALQQQGRPCDPIRKITFEAFQNDSKTIKTEIESKHLRELHNLKKDASTLTFDDSHLKFVYLLTDDAIEEMKNTMGPDELAEIRRKFKNTYLIGKYALTDDALKAMKPGEVAEILQNAPPEITTVKFNEESVDCKFKLRAHLLPIGKQVDTVIFENFDFSKWEFETFIKFLQSFPPNVRSFHLKHCELPGISKDPSKEEHEDLQNRIQNLKRILNAVPGNHLDLTATYSNVRGLLDKIGLKAFLELLPDRITSVDLSGVFQRSIVGETLNNVDAAAEVVRIAIGCKKTIEFETQYKDWAVPDPKAKSDFNLGCQIRREFNRVLGLSKEIIDPDLADRQMKQYGCTSENPDATTNAEQLKHTSQLRRYY